MKILKNSGRYITKDTLKKCFERGKHLKVDKGIAGNGFTTAFMESRVPSGKINILIMPNKGVLKSKEAEYKKKVKSRDRRTAFIYGDGEDRIKEGVRLYVIIIDKFVLEFNYFKKHANSINWILIDESHTVKTDSVFRGKLKGFDEKVKPFFMNHNVAVTSVTASPMLYTKSDIFIENEDVPEVIIKLSPDRGMSIENAIEDLKNDESVLVATNSKNVIYQFKDSNGVIRADFHVGNRLMQQLLTMATILQDDKSKLTIISKAAFEGIDKHGSNFNIYFFEDRGKEYESFYVANMYQAISRVRSGANWIEYSRREHTSDIIDVDKLEARVDRFISRKDISAESKQNSKYNDLQKYLLFNIDDGRLKVEKDKVAFELLRERIEYNKGFNAFKDFFKKRNITIEKIQGEEQTVVKQVRISKKNKLENLTSNYRFIRSSGIFNDENFPLKLTFFNRGVNYRKQVEDYLMFKQYDWQDNDVENEDKTRPLKPREEILLELFSDDGKMKKLIKRVTTANSKAKRSKHGHEKSKVMIEDFNKKAPFIVRKICAEFGNGKIRVQEKMRGFRDYNVFTELSNSAIELIANEFDIEVVEADIKNAYPRIIYALNGLELPDNFYGKNKKNKLAISVEMNNFRFNNKLNTSEAQQRSDSRKKLKKLGFDDKVVTDLMDRFFISPHKGDLFNYLAYHEKQIIDAVKQELIHEVDYGFVRKHDALLIFNKPKSFKNIGAEYLQGRKLLEDFEYLGVKGWFDV